VSPTVAVAPKLTGTSTHIVWLIVNAQAPFFFPGQGFSPETIMGSPQHFVTVGPVWANGDTITGTQTDAF